jgi:penicillin-binding protein 2
VRRIWEALYGIEENGPRIRPSRAAIPGVVQSSALPVFAPDGAILPPARRRR